MDLVETEEMDKKIATVEFVKSSFNSVLKLHEEILASKNTNLNQLKEENKFLKELIISIQDINSEDRETIDILTKQIKSLQEELEFTKRKYKLMWNKAVENYKK
jgi:septal ring factor EnvC (AmiA/AmiB activator)